LRGLSRRGGGLAHFCIKGLQLQPTLVALKLPYSENPYRLTEEFIGKKGKRRMKK